MLAVPQAVTDNRVKLSGHRQSTETDSKKQLLAVPQAVADNRVKIIGRSGSLCGLTQKH